MRTHPLIGHEILKDSASMFVRMGALVALGHHERFDGSGYPYGRASAEIPLCARIVAVADVFDALTSERPYKRAWPNEDAFAYLKQQRGKHLDPELVEAFIGATARIVRVQREHSDGHAAASPGASEATRALDFAVREMSQGAA